MHRNFGRARAWMLAFAASLSASAEVIAQQSVPGVDVNYQSIVDKRKFNYGTPGNDLGEQIDHQSGQLQFNVVDVSIPGSNDLPVEFRRRINATRTRYYSDGYIHNKTTRLRGWDIALPKIEATYDAQAGWVTSDSARNQANCSVADWRNYAPPKGTLNYRPVHSNVRGVDEAFPPESFWEPPAIVWPLGNTSLLALNAGRVREPSGGQPYYWVTSDLTYVSCLPRIANRNNQDGTSAQYGAGEGYFAVKPDGTKYWFDWMALEQIIPLKSGVVSTFCSWTCEDVAGSVSMRQARLALYVTRVEDRHGNWVVYSYSNNSDQKIKLDRIYSSDGREIRVEYENGIISSVTAEQRVWRYTGSDDLTVVNPDQSVWRYEGPTYTAAPWPYNNNNDGRCRETNWLGHVNNDWTQDSRTDFQGFTVHTPSGLTAVYRVEPVMLGKSNVARTCYVSGYVLRYGFPFQLTAPREDLGGMRPVVVAKRVSGPGVPERIWRYSYQSVIGFGPSTGGRTTSKILHPDGVLEVSEYGNAARLDEGLLLTKQISVGAGVLRREVFQYALDGESSSFPHYVGMHPLEGVYARLAFRPQTSQVVEQSGRRFVRQVSRTCGGQLCFDGFGRPTRVDVFSE